MELDIWGNPPTPECEHEWEKVTLTKCHVITNDDGEPIVILDPETRSHIGCGICYMLLDEVYPVTT